MEPEGRRLAAFSAAVRESTLKRLRAVPEGRELFRVDAASMSFADLALHLLEADARLFRRIHDVKIPPPVRTRPRFRARSRNAYLALLERLTRSGARRRRFIERLTRADLARIRDDPYYGRASGWWYLLRSCLDHEIHHRGQIPLMLRLCRKPR